MGQERVIASSIKHENSMWRRNAEEIFSEGLWKSGEMVNAAVICTCDPDPVGVNGGSRQRRVARLGERQPPRSALYGQVTPLHLRTPFVDCVPPLQLMYSSASGVSLALDSLRGVASSEY